jgi:hypothetical protein
VLLLSWLIVVSTAPPALGLLIVVSVVVGGTAVLVVS